MKKTLLLLLSVAVWQVSNAQFTADNLVVVKSTPYTDQIPSTPVVYKNAGAVSLVEMNLDGTGAKETAIPNFYVGHSASTLNNGILKLSSDNKYLTMYGYNSASLPNPADGNLAPSINSRTLLVVDNNKTINTLDIPKNSDNKVLHSNTQVRSAIAFNKSTNVYSIYLGGGSNAGGYCGIQYIELNTTTNAITSPIDITDLNTGSLGIFNNQLYSTTGLINNPATNRFNQIGVGLPNTSGSVTDLTSIISNSDIKIPGDFVFFGSNLLYIADETASTGGIHKFYFDGTNWVAKGKVQSGITNDLLFRGLTGRLENGKVTLYGVTTVSAGNSVVKIIDKTAANATVSNANADITVLATSIATGNNKYGYRGISFTPNSTITLPVTLDNFTAKVANGNVELNWSTLSESNNKGFEVLRSTDGKNFTKIGEVVGNNNSSSKNAYSFTDKTVAQGTYYYQLNQVDNNGATQTYGPKVVNIGLSDANFNISVLENIIQVNLNITQRVNNAQLSIIDIAGKLISKQNVNLNSGKNQFILNAPSKNGVYILKIDGNNLLETKKFIK